MSTITRLSLEEFLDDTHASRYQDQTSDHPEAFRGIFQIINDPAHEQRLLDAEAHGLPALAGVARFLEADPAVATVLAGPDATRFKQAVGVVIRVKMETLGWHTTGRKGPVRGSACFSKAERYQQGHDGEEHEDVRAQSLAVLDQLDDIGNETERAETGRTLQEALAMTRAAEGRPF